MRGARLSGAITAVREAAAAAGDIPLGRIEAADDFVDDLIFDELELESLGLIIEELFAVPIPPGLWDSPLYRTAESLAEWLIRKSDEEAWAELRKRA